MLRKGCLVLILATACSLLSAQGGQTRRVQSPVERNRFALLTSYDSLIAFVGSIAGCPGMGVSTLGTTRSGRSVFVVRYSPKNSPSNEPPLKVLLFAQQHGDEPSGKEALTVLLAKCASGEAAAMLQGIDLRIVPQMNPDGSELRRRRTSDSLDLNRSHLLLSSPETAALHELFYEWQPQVTMDIHEFGAYSESWSKAGFIKRADVQMGTLTNLNSSENLRSFEHTMVFPFVADRMRAAGYAFEEYIVGSPEDRIRHSTTEINDGRQSFGILNTMSFIQEGRGGKTLEQNLERRVRSQLTSIEALLTFCREHAEVIARMVTAERARLSGQIGSPFVLRMEHIHGTGVLRIPVTLVPSGRDTVLAVGPYHDVVHPLATTTVPSGYYIPASQHSVIDLLKRHHVLMEQVTGDRTIDVERYWIDSVGFDVLEEDTLPRPFVHTTLETVTVHPGDVVVSTAQWHSMFLPTTLEPESMWGILKYDAFAPLLKEKRYPICRLR
jgi:hypothetical protein